MASGSSVLAWVVSALYSVCGLAFALIGGWLWAGKVQPNRVTGFRTAKTLADPEVWYRVNTAGGSYLFWLGIIILVVTWGLHLTVTKDRPALAALSLTGLTVVGTLLIAFLGARLQ